MTLMEFIRANPELDDVEILAERNAPVTTANTNDDRWLTWNRIRLLLVDQPTVLTSFAEALDSATELSAVVKNDRDRIVNGPGIDMALPLSQAGVQAMVGSLIDQATADLFKSIGFTKTSRNETQADIDAARAAIGAEQAREWFNNRAVRANERISQGGSLEQIKGDVLAIVSEF